MRKCKHENADHLMPGDWLHLYRCWPTHQVAVEQFRCIDCGAYLSLGPARDNGPHAEAVAIEVRAAELAPDGSRPRVANLAVAVAYAAQCGLDDKQPAFAWSCGWNGLESAWLAGYLARCIATHGEE